MATDIAPLLRWATSAGRLVIASAATTLGFNLAMADPYVSIIVSAETYRGQFQQARLDPVVQSSSIATSGTLFSALIPWNVHGAFVAGILGMGTFALAGYAVVIWATPLALVAAALILTRRNAISPSDDPNIVYGSPPVELP